MNFDNEYIPHTRVVYDQDQSTKKLLNLQSHWFNVTKCSTPEEIQVEKIAVKTSVLIILWFYQIIPKFQ